MDIESIVKVIQALDSQKKSKKPQHECGGETKIIILQRGWIAVGKFYKKGSQCRLTKAAIIRKWGTTKGLGEIAMCGPTSDTVLDKSPDLEFHELTVVATMACSEDKWASKL